MFEPDFQALEQFVEIKPVQYSSTMNTCEINVVRKILFAKGGRISKNNPNVACIGVGKPDKVLDDESERNIN